ncbi:MAG: ABC transporter ATP-binding protein [Pyrinomonadaceae bacterium]|nr:ABC transporter ATP-binding protein [Pyrinomonadaceae bacterium]
MNEIIVSLENVCKIFDGAARVTALDGVGLEVPRGQRVSVMGPSGSGKSTLLNIVCGLDVPTSGRVLINGSDLAAMSDDDRTRLRREQIGMIFQTFNLMPTLNGVENVALPLRLCGMSGNEAADRAAAMLERVGLSGRGSHRPDEMSGGERQRVAIARALIFDPPLLLADEPTGNLDSATGDEILKLLEDVHNEFGTSMILVTHNENAAAICERRIDLLDGRIVSDTLRSPK